MENNNSIFDNSNNYNDILYLQNVKINNWIVHSNELLSYNFNEDPLYKRHIYPVKPSLKSQPNIIIKEPIVIFKMNHNCYGHALIDNLFVEYCVIENINNKFNTKIKYFIKRNSKFLFLDNLLQVPKLNLVKDTCYLFENVYLMKQAKYPYLLEWSQRSPFNNFYKGNPKSRCLTPIYDDETMSKYLLEFQKLTLQKYSLYNKIYDKKNIIIINRSQPPIHKQFDFNILSKLNDIITTFISKNPEYYYNGVHILEDIDHKAQVELFYSSDIIIAKSGSAATNTIFMQKNSNYIEIDYTVQHKRLCNLVSVNYYDLHSKLDYISGIEKILNDKFLIKNQW